MTVKLYTSIKVGHSRTSVYLEVWYGLPTIQAKTTFYLHISINDPIAPPSFLGLNEGQKALLFKHETLEKYVWLMDLNIIF